MFFPHKKRTLSALCLTASFLLLPTLSWATPTVQAGFSPEGSAQALVIQVINASTKNIRMMGYSFTAPDIMQALLAAKKRGVDVKIVLDDRGNRGKASVAAMNLVTNGGIDLRTNSHYKIQHDKVLIVDNETVETGSFNFTTSAEKHNSENALVVWHDADLATTYAQHWQSRWEQGVAYTSSY